jgi:hypothetical protein
VSFDAHPDRSGDDTSWHSPVWVLPRATEVERGAQIALTYRFAGAYAKLTVEPVMP